MNFRMPALLIFFLLICLPLRSEHIFLKDGSIISGQVVRDGADSVSIRDSDKKTRDVKRSDIMRILYTELKMGKIYIQKRDGKGIVAHMVDEDRDSYTFRLDLYKPEEFILKRSAVLFIAEKNPSGLQVVGDIGTDRVALTWEPPYDRVKTYKVYIKKNDKDRYELADSTGGRSVTLKGLTSNTGYFMIVTSVDTANYESSPSNELQVRTKNMPPDEPDRVLYTLDATGTRKVTWKPARDPDGTVVKYRIYTRHGGEKKLLKETKTGTCTAGPEVTEKIYVCAVDNMGDESGLVRASKLSNMKTYVSVLADGLMPLVGFGDTAGPGPGVTLQFGREDCFFEGLVLGAEAGFYTFTGKSSEFKDTGLSYMASLLLTAGYRFEMNYYFSLTPYLALGAAWFQSDLTNRDEVTLNESKESVSEIGPVMAAGFTGAYRLNESVSLLLRFCSGYLAGSDSGLYAGCALGCMYRL